jgi:hypothetical protein
MLQAIICALQAQTVLAGKDFLMLIFCETKVRQR